MTQNHFTLFAPLLNPAKCIFWAGANAHEKISINFVIRHITIFRIWNIKAMHFHETYTRENDPLRFIIILLVSVLPLEFFVGIPSFTRSGSEFCTLALLFAPLHPCALFAYNQPNAFNLSMAFVHSVAILPVHVHSFVPLSLPLERY